MRSRRSHTLTPLAHSDACSRRYAICPAGAAACSHGCSERARERAQPVDTDAPIHPAPQGAEDSPMANDHAMNSRRPHIPAALKNTVLYKAGHACCVCRDGHTRVQLHHIDGNPANNTEDNLVALCLEHHNEAEITGGLTQRLDANKLRGFKAKWEADVRAFAELRISAANATALNIRQWNYFNITLLLECARAANIDVGSLPAVIHARSMNVLDEAFVPIDNERSLSARTLFHAYPYQQSHSLYAALSELTEHSLRAAPPVQLKWAWSRRYLRHLAEHHAIVYANRAFRFRIANDVGHRECRIAKYTKSRIILRFMLDTWYVHSMSALSLHYQGCSRIGAVLRLRSAEINDINGKPCLVVNATPIACGSGFPADVDHAPLISFRDQIENDVDFP